MPKTPDSTLVNQKPDSIPFGEQSESTPATPPSDEVLELRSKLQAAHKELAFVRESNIVLEERSNTMNEQLKLAKEPIMTPEQPTLKRQIFLAIIQGMAAHGDLSLGTLANDSHTTTVARHAAGVASFMAQAAKDAKLVN